MIMIIKKFGGSSIGSPERMQRVIKLITSEIIESKKYLVVLSAIGGVTDILESINTDSEYSFYTEKLKSFYLSFTKELFDKEHIKEAKEIINDSLLNIKSAREKNDYKSVLAEGELFSTKIFYLLCQQNALNANLYKATDILKIDENEIPDYNQIYDKLKSSLISAPSFNIIQGFICRNHKGETDNLKRGGSDYSAAIYGAALNADKIEIWSDIDGVHNCDPRFVENTKPIAELDYEEAAEMAYFGAKVLHPSTLLPARKNNIPVLLKNTLKPKKPGTLIHAVKSEKGIRAIAAKDNITVIRIQSDRMLMAYGFLSKVFEVFSKYKTPIDMITTSEVAVAMTIDNDSMANEIIMELSDFGKVEIEKNQCIVSVIGKMKKEDRGYGKMVFDALADIPVSMISYGASEHNISILLKSEDKVKTLNKLHSELL